MHAGDVDGAIHRLENEPLNVPRTMLQALDIISIQAMVYRGRERERRLPGDRGDPGSKRGRRCDRRRFGGRPGATGGDRRGYGGRPHGACRRGS
jgi:hypothetical protein